MKKLSFITLITLLSIATQAQEWGFGYDKTIKNIKATVKILDNKETFVLVPNDNLNGRYIAYNLPEEYKVEGLKVTITGDVGIIPPNVRMLGTPLKLKLIAICKCEQKKYKLSKRKYIFN